MRTQKILLSLLVLFISQYAFSANSTKNAKQYWQLIFSYSGNEITLIDAAKIPKMRKKIQSPGSLASVINLPYTLEWLDENGRVITQTDIEIPLGIRNPIDVNSPGNDEFIPEKGSFVLRIEGPKDLQPESLLLKPDELKERNINNDKNLPLIFEKKEIIFNIDYYKKTSQLSDGPVSTTKIQDTGSDDNRLVLVIMGDGYTTADLASGAFSNAVVSYLNYNMSQSPWNVIDPAINIYGIDIESKESGADYEDASPGSGGTQKDTYFDSQFWFNNIERLLYVNNPSRVYSAANDNIGVGNWDKILIFVNSTKYGGGGGSFAVSSVHSSSQYIMIHEMGHSFAGLADEYGGSGTYTGPNPSRPNVDISSNNPKWKVWIEATTPLPTPDTPAYNNSVGTFEGAYYKDYGIYRPWRYCCMRSLGNDFCPVCKEGHLMEYFNMVIFADSLSPDNSSSVIIVDSQLFSLTPIPISGFSYQWFLSGSRLANETNETLTLYPSRFTTTNETLTATILYETELIRATTISQTFSWAVTIPEPGSISAICLLISVSLQIREKF